MLERGQIVLADQEQRGHRPGADSRQEIPLEHQSGPGEAGNAIGVKRHRLGQGSK